MSTGGGLTAEGGTNTAGETAGTGEKSTGLAGRMTTPGARPMVICEPLCFLVKKRGRYAPTDLKTLMFNFYKGEQIAAAKELLVESVALLHTEPIKNALRMRRDNKEQKDAKIRNDLDDLIIIMTYIDERKFSDNLPIFVAADPDLIPSARLGDGDMLSLLSKLEKLDERFSSMHAELENTRAIFMRGMSSGLPPGVTQNKGTGSKTLPSAAVLVTREESGIATGGATRGAAAANNLTDTEQSSARDSEYDDEEEFTTQVSRNARRAAKRMRASDSPSSPSYVSAASKPPTSAASQTATSKAPNKPQQRPKALIGQSTTCPMKAAKNLNIAKAVFRIGNIDSCYTESNLKEYIEDKLGVHVISCYDRTSETNRYADNKSFRVCIFEADKAKLLCDSSWSVGISISKWVFKPKPEGGEAGGTGGTARTVRGAEGGVRGASDNSVGARGEEGEGGSEAGSLGRVGDPSMES